MRLGTSAPLRIDFTGGYTDIPEIYERVRGVALNLAIDYRTRAVVAEASTEGYCSDLPWRRYHASSDSSIFAERLLFQINRLTGRDEVRAVFVRADGPNACGLGSSASLAVAITALVAADLSKWAMVEVAHRAELEAGNKCGMQDHVAATYGGVNALEFPHAASYSPPSMSSAQLRALGQHCSLWLAKAPRASSSLVEQVLLKLRKGDRSTRGALSRLNDAYPMLRDALLEYEIYRLIEGVKEVHAAQVALQEGIVPSSVRRLAGIIEERFGGAVKLMGGGGVGSASLVLLPDEFQSELERLMISDGYRPLRLGFESSGVLMHRDDWPVEEYGGDPE